MAAEKKLKKRRGRWSYVDDFQRSASGEMIYMGALYAYSDAAGRPRKKLLTWLLAAASVSVAAMLAQGLLPVAGMRGCAYVLLPYVGELFSSISVLWALIRLSLNREPLREYVYVATAQALPLRTVLTAVSAGATLLGDTIYLALHGMPQPGLSLPFLGLSLLCLGGALTGIRLRRGADWQRQVE